MVGVSSSAVALVAAAVPVEQGVENAVVASLEGERPAAERSQSAVDGEALSSVGCAWGYAGGLEAERVAESGTEEVCGACDGGASISGAIGGWVGWSLAVESSGCQDIRVESGRRVCVACSLATLQAGKRWGKARWYVVDGFGFCASHA